MVLSPFPVVPVYLFYRFIAMKVCTTCSRTNNKIVPPTNLNKYLYSVESEVEVNINNSSAKNLKDTTTVGELITAECASVVHPYIS